MKALVTGANSLVGASIVRALLSGGHQVRAFVRPTSDTRSLDGLAVEKVPGDILDVDSLVAAAKGCQTMYHAAAIFSYSGHTPQELLAVATQGTRNAVDAAKNAKVRRVVLTSSSLVVGSTLEPAVLDEKNPAPEPDPGAYALSKMKQEETGLRRAQELGVDLVAVCPTLCIGPHDYRLSESNAIVLNYLKDPFRATWPGGCNIVSAEDVARGHVLAARHGKSGQRYILGSQNLEWSAVHRIISELCGIQGPLVTASHTACFLVAVAQEITCRFTRRRPLVTREQSRMTGRYYWYSHDRAASFGYNPMPARRALAKAISWLTASHHMPASLRNTLTLSEEVYRERE